MEIAVNRMLPKVSVIIPVYNVEKYVEQSVSSILNQSLKEIEIIIVNDGSKDKSLDIVNCIANKDKRVHIISTPNNGLSIARNIGLYNASGEYVYFFDSDDILEEKTLEECYLKSKLLNLDFLFFDAICFTDDKDVDLKFNYERTYKYKDEVYTGIEMLRKQMNTGGYSSSACLSFINREFLIKENLSFYPRILHEDELFTFILYLKAQKVGFINKSFFQRRVRANSIMTNTYNMRNVNGYMTVAQELFKCYKFSLNKLEKDLLLNNINILIGSLYIASLNNLKKDEIYRIRLYILKNFFKVLKFKTQVKILMPLSLLAMYNKSVVVKK